MKNAPNRKASGQGLRTGTASFAKGKARSVEILQAAQYILAHEGYENFTMRNIGARVGIRLGNLQYYYQTKTDLLRDLLKFVGESYDQQYVKLFAKIPDDPALRFKAVIDYLLADLKKLEVRGFFAQTRALMTHDAYVGELMAEAYAYYRSVLSGLVSHLNPALSKRDSDQRAALIQALIEGSTFTQTLQGARLVQQPGLDDLIRERAYRIATR